MQGLEPAKTLVDQAYEVILNALCDGTFQPGERLTQEEIASRLNVSRQPVTHALNILKSQGFLAQAGRRGLKVTPVDLNFLEAIYQLRSVVEPLAVKLATPKMTEKDIQEGQALVSRGREVAKSGDSKAVQQADMDFHSFIYQLSGNPLIAETMRLHWNHLRRGMGRVLNAGPATGIWNEHGYVLDAMSRGEADEAAEFMRKHLVDACERVRKSSSEPA